MHLSSDDGRERRRTVSALVNLLPRAPSAWLETPQSHDRLRGRNSG